MYSHWSGPERLGLCQDIAPRTEESGEAQSPTLCEGTQGVVPETPTCDAPANDESFRPTLDCFVGAVALQCVSGCAGQPPFSHGPLAGADLGGLRSEIKADQPDDIPTSRVAAAADDHDHEATVSSNERALNLVDQDTAPASSTSNFSQITGDKPESGLARDGPLKNSHTSCSVSVTIPATRPSTSATWTHARHNQAGRTRKRNDRSAGSSKVVDSDDPHDDDYVHVDGGLSDMETQPRPAKRRRRTGASATTAGRKQSAARSFTPATTAPSRNQPSNQSQPTNSPDPETIPVQGCSSAKFPFPELNIIVASRRTKVDRLPSNPTR